VDCALAVVAKGRAMKAVCEALGLARSHIDARAHRLDHWRDGRMTRTPVPDEELLREIRQHIAQLPSYGYRRACALVNRQRVNEGRAVVNPKRAYRVMAQAKLLLPKAPRRPQSSRKHEGKVAVSTSDTRWCSDGFEIKCDSGETVTATFAQDCCDREVMAWRAWPGKGLPGEPVREMLIEAVERRFGAVEAMPEGRQLEFLTDNGGAYIAGDTRAIARALGLKPVNTPVCSPQSNGMAESFVNTFKRDYVSRMDLADATTVMAQLPAAFEHFNNVHPHSSLKMRLPREFRQHQQRVAQTRRASTSV
jgi:putative transposase